MTWTVSFRIGEVKCWWPGRHGVGTAGVANRAARTGHGPVRELGQDVPRNVDSESGRERPPATARNTAWRASRGGSLTPRLPPAVVLPTAVGRQKTPPRSRDHHARGAPQLAESVPFAGTGGLEVARRSVSRFHPARVSTRGDNSPPVSCPPVCPPSSTTHDVPTREERWRYGRARTCASRRPVPRLMASASAGEHVASTMLAPSRSQAR